MKRNLPTTTPSGASSYDDRFYDMQNSSARASADEIVPIVMRTLRPKTIVDVGCGKGAWSMAFHDAGCETTSIDAIWNDLSELALNGMRTHQCDLSQPIVMDRTFDVAVCLEVAEHLDASSAEILVKSLCELAPLVLFSAAFPGQAGTHHVNEQFPSWWVERFAEHDRVPHDLVRPHVWNNPAVAYWYAQNTLLFVPRDHALASTPPVMTDVVHPRMYRVAQRRLGSVREVAKVLPKTALRSLWQRRPRQGRG